MWTRNLRKEPCFYNRHLLILYETLLHKGKLGQIVGWWTIFFTVIYLRSFITLSITKHMLSLVYIFHTQIDLVSCQYIQSLYIITSATIHIICFSCSSSWKQVWYIEMSLICIIKVSAGTTCGCCGTSESTWGGKVRLSVGGRGSGYACYFLWCLRNEFQLNVLWLCWWGAHAMWHR